MIDLKEVSNKDLLNELYRRLSGAAAPVAQQTISQPVEDKPRTFGQSNGGPSEKQLEMIRKWYGLKPQIIEKIFQDCNLPCNNIRDSIDTLSKKDASNVMSLLFERMGWTKK